MSSIWFQKSSGKPQDWDFARFQVSEIYHGDQFKSLGGCTKVQQNHFETLKNVGEATHGFLANRLSFGCILEIQGGLIATWNGEWLYTWVPLALLNLSFWTKELFPINILIAMTTLVTQFRHKSQPCFLKLTCFQN